MTNSFWMQTICIAATATALSLAHAATPLDASAVAAPSTARLAQAIDRAHQLHLADAPYWQRLMYYQKSGKGMQSSVTQPSFFLAPSGRSDPSAELDATLTGLLTPVDAQSNQATACLFPVRRDWLVEQLGLSTADLPVTPCPELTAWLQGIQPRHATLVFSSDYMNNPSSMFGHTLLRLDPDENEKTRLLSYAINYAARTDGANSAAFALKGLTGRYPGAYAILPYYEKVREYNDFESRDLWEYGLTLTPEETLRLTKRVWELRFVTFPYYFLHSNCSYMLLGLLEVARPSLNLQRELPLYAIPTDTLRIGLQNGKLLDKISYRPAFASRLNAQAAHATPATVRAAKRLTHTPDDPLTGLTLRQQAQATEMAGDYEYQQFVGHKIESAEAQPVLRTLLVRRSQFDVPDTRVTVPTPVVDPANGHLTSRVMIGGGDDAGRGFADLSWRPAYHDLLDSAAGYRNGSAIDFLNTTLRVHDDRIDLHKLTLLEIQSLSPKTEFFDPLSWNLSLGVRQVPIAAGTFSRDQTHAVSYLQGGEGKAWKFGEVLCYGLATGAVEAGHALDKGWRAGIGPSLGCLWNQPAVSLMLEGADLYWQDSHSWQSQLKLGAQIPLGTDQRQALRVNLQQSQQGSQRHHEASLAWLRYF
jgi:hypothetical protein